MYQNEGANVNSISEMLDPTIWQRPNSGPRYLQLGRHIAQAIQDGALREDTSLPSERDMARFAQVSRVTIRKAIAFLANETLVTQRHGSGNYITPPGKKVPHTLTRISSFTEQMRRRGRMPKTEVISTGIVIPSPEEIVTLGLGANDKVARVERLRRADGVPMAFEQSALPPDILPDPEEVTSSLYKVLQSRNLKPVRALQRISAVRLTPAQAQLLEIGINDPALKIVRTGYLASGRIIEFTTGIHRGDAYDFIAELVL